MKKYIVLIWSLFIFTSIFSSCGGDSIKTYELKDFADKILRVGNTINPDEAFRNFMGRDADVEALVNRSVDFSE